MSNIAGLKAILFSQLEAHYTEHNALLRAQKQCAEEMKNIRQRAALLRELLALDGIEVEEKKMPE